MLKTNIATSDSIVDLATMCRLHLQNKYLGDNQV